MRKTNIMILLFIFLMSIGYTQSNFTFTPEKPKAGDVIQITYSPAGNLAYTKSPITAVVNLMGNSGFTANDVVLTNSGSSYNASIKTDTSNNFLFFSFSADKNFDNNYNNGYWIQLYDGDKVKKGSNEVSLNFTSFMEEISE